MVKSSICTTIEEYQPDALVFRIRPTIRLALRLV